MNPRRTWPLSGLLAIVLLGALARGQEEPRFLSARPVWLPGRETEMNLTVGFRACFDWPADPVARRRATLKIAAATIYRASINGRFLARGPARGPHGFYRVDSLDITRLLSPGRNLVAIEVAGYNVNSYDLLDQPSFLQAEVVSGGEVHASTAGAGAILQAQTLEERVQKVQRFSFQRPFIEVYRLRPGADRWRRETAASTAAVPTAVVPVKKLLSRGVLLPEFRVRQPAGHVARGQMKKRAKIENPWKDRSLVAIGPQLKGYPEAELEVIPSLDLQRWATASRAPLDRPYTQASSMRLTTGAYHILDLGVNSTGMLGAEITCTRKTRLWFTFDEILSTGDVDFKRLGCVNAITYELEPGTYQVESIEPNTMRYVKVICPEGDSTVKNLYLRQYAHPKPRQAHFACSDKRLNRLYAAGVETFRQNALDLFMDCPSRERAGWLCDSFFTARPAHDLTGVTRIETNFYENFLLPERFSHLPEGMLPMCYPADHYDGVFIPNWSLWFVVQLEEYLGRSGNREMVDALRPKVMRLLEYFRLFENSDGLLEKLESWVFVEWSAANKFVQDVNYPSNMLYAGALAAAGRMYGLPELEQQAEQIRAVIRRQSFDGQFFVDNAMRRDGKLEVTRNRSEVCQYFAFFFDVATRKSQPRLWATLRDQFGPDRNQTKVHQEVQVANSFIGNMLRMELLSAAGRSQQILDESVSYLLYMAARTGTLWENDGAYASCNHGFAAHIVHTLYRDVLGLARVDRVDHVVRLRFGDTVLDWCEGSVPTPDGAVRLCWSSAGEVLTYQLDLPDGYQVEVENQSGKRLVRE